MGGFWWGWARGSLPGGPASSPGGGRGVGGRLAGTEFAGCRPSGQSSLVLTGPPDLPGLQPPARPGERGGQGGSEACCKDERLLGGCQAGPLPFSVLRDHSCRLRGGPEPSGYFLRASDAARQSLDWSLGCWGALVLTYPLVADLLPLWFIPHPTSLPCLPKLGG